MSAQQPESEIRLLLIDDEEVIHKSVGDFLKKMGYQVAHASNGTEGLEYYDREKPDIIISDVKMPDFSGIELLRALKDRLADVEVILITGHGDIDTAIQALREGAFDFFSKPIKLEELMASLERTKRYQGVRREKDRIQERLEALLCSGSDTQRKYNIIGESQAIRQVLDLVNKVAWTDHTTVLIQGESGTGKELVAHAIHNQSPRKDNHFISINCTAVPDSLFESELFGHERGAFTDAKTSKKGMFELGDGSTLMLDEVGDMSASSQAKILRVLEERRIRRVGGIQEIPVDVRLVAATNQDLKSLLDEGRFRQDLYFRLNVFTIVLPPLRERGDDVLLLAYHFLREFANEFRKDITGIDNDVQKLLKQYRFPGNVRELRNLIERAVILCEGKTLTKREFSLSDMDTGPATADLQGEDMPLNLSDLEGRAIRLAMTRANNNQTEAARYLGIGHDALRYRIKKYNI